MLVKKNFSVFPILISQLQLEPVFPLYFQRHYAVPTVVYESPPVLKQRILGGFIARRKMKPGGDLERLSK